MKILGTASSEAQQLLGVLTDHYDLHETYVKAHAKNDPDLAPHGFFRKLRFGNDDEAREFLETFGPLELTSPERLSLTDVRLGVDLRKFWSLQLRFSLVAAAWESLDDREQLANAIYTLYERRRELSEYQEFPLGQIFGPPPASEPRGTYEFPWQPKGQEAATWLKTATLEEMRNYALQLVFLELNIHIRDTSIRWERGPGVSGRRFRTVVWVDSLWSAIWEFWGWDTTGLSWRRCPHCQIFFYPKRHDQFYCTPRQQALWSKRRYAAEQRALELRRKRKNGRRIAKRG